MSRDNPDRPTPSPRGVVPNRWDRLVAAAVVLLTVGVVAAPVLANGVIGGDSPPTRIPIPARDFTMTVEDIGGTTTTVRRATFNGEVHLYGRLGEAQVTVPFEQIAEVRIEPSTESDHRVALVVLRTGDKVRVLIEDDVPCYGEATFGFFKIEASKVARIRFPAPAAP